jgi:hypothetical protein
MPLSWNEIRHRAIAFTREWWGETRGAAERQSFWNEFFNVFGIRRRTVATFEEPVKKLSGDWGFIDLFWAGGLPGPALLQAPGGAPMPASAPIAWCPQCARLRAQAARLRRVIHSIGTREARNRGKKQRRFALPNETKLAILPETYD